MANSCIPIKTAPLIAQRGRHRTEDSNSCQRIDNPSMSSLVEMPRALISKINSANPDVALPKTTGGNLENILIGHRMILSRNMFPGSRRAVFRQSRD